MTIANRGLRAGVIFAILVSMVLPASADGIDPSKLVRFSDMEGVTHEDWVSTDPISSAVIKKIEAGRVSYVTVTTTATGTYSTDGIRSPNVSYPGVTEPSNPRNEFSFSSWSDGRWSRIETYRGNSYVSVSTLRASDGHRNACTCISTASFLSC